MKLLLDAFKPALPRLAAHLLAPGQAQTAVNCDTRRGALAPWAGLATVLAAHSSIATLHKYAGNGFTWLAWSGNVSVVPSLVPGDTDLKVFWSGDGAPKQSSYTRLGSGSGYLLDPDADHSYPLGLPAPDTPPTVTLTGAPSAEFAETRTYVYAWAWKGNLGAMSATCTGTIAAGTEGQAVYLDGFEEQPAATDGDFKVTIPASGGKKVLVANLKKWLFRYDSVSGMYVLIAKLDPNQTAYTDDGKVFRTAANQLIRRKSTAFKSSRIAAPSATPTTATQDASKVRVTREYFYCWTWQLDGVAYYSSRSATASLSNVANDEGVALTGMVTAPPVALPAGADTIHKSIFRKDGSAVWRLVAHIGGAQSDYTDRKPTAKLRKALSNWAQYNLDAPAAPTVALLDAIATSSETRTTAYVWTYVTDAGEESAPSEPSSVDIADWQSPVIYQPGSAPSGYPNITYWRLYRTDLNGTYRLLKTGPKPSDAADPTAYRLPIGTTSYTDTITEDALGPTLVTQEWDPPPSDLHSLVALPGEVLAGLSGNRVCFSEPGVPYAWPAKYRQTLAWTGVALAVGAAGLLVATQGFPYASQGFDPAAMTLYRLDGDSLDSSDYACVSAVSMVDMGAFVIYACPNGLVLSNGNSARLVTREVLLPEQWAAYVPASIRGFRHEGRYVGFYDTGSTQGGFVFDPHEPGWTDLTGVYAGAGFTDPVTDYLYLRVGSDLKRWRGDTGNPLTQTWRSGRLVSDLPITPMAARVDAEAYPVTFKLYADGALKHTQTVANAKPFRLPAGYQARAFDVELSGTQEIRRVVVGETLAEVAA